MRQQRGRNGCSAAFSAARRGIDAEPRLAWDEAHPQYRLGQIRSGAHADRGPRPLIALVLVLRDDLRSLAWLQGLVDSERATPNSVL